MIYILKSNIKEIEKGEKHYSKLVISTRQGFLRTGADECHRMKEFDNQAKIYFVPIDEKE